jgi:hypothetical protein
MNQNKERRYFDRLVYRPYGGEYQVKRPHAFYLGVQKKSKGLSILTLLLFFVGMQRRGT